jgi:superfamily II DNA or RNA helicase
MDIKIHKRDESKIVVECPEGISKELWNYLSAYVPNFRFSPLYKSGIWNGRIHFLDIRDNSCGIGLVGEVLEFAKKGHYGAEVGFENGESVSVEEFREFVEGLDITDSDGDPMAVRDYQMQAAFDSLRKCNINIESVTSSGKSLILYIIIRWMESKGKKVILIVPRIGLVEQMFSDFESYGWDDIGGKCRMIYGGEKKVFDCLVTVSTWQSIFRNTKLFEAFDCMIIDEAHEAKGKSLQSIAAACMNARWRIGCSGTYPEYRSCDWFSIVGSIGPLKKYSSYKSLQDAGHIAKLKIFSVVLRYPLDYRLNVFDKAQKDYSEETDIVNESPDRCRFILKMAQNLKGNTLILFTKVEKHGVPLHSLFSKELRGKALRLIHGGIDKGEREKIRQEIGRRDDIVLLASYGTFSLGTNAPNVRNVIFASGYKSRVKVLQSIGRGLRKHEGKTHMTLLDIVDDLSFNDKARGISYENHSMRHFRERVKIYSVEGFKPVTKYFDIK